MHVLPHSRFLAAGLLAVVWAVSAAAQSSLIPSAMSYQGTLTDDQGNLVANASPENRNLEFRIYDAATGGNVLWGEAQTVTVYKGAFSVVLGNGSAVSGAASGQAAFAAAITNLTSTASPDRYFAIRPQGGADFAPRQKLLPGAFALRARVAEQVNASAQPNTSPALFNNVTANSLTLAASSGISLSNSFEFGLGVAGKQEDAGKIGYQRFSQGLDIIGAGTSQSNRQVTIWGEGGTTFKGPITIANYNQSINLYDSFNGIGVQAEGIYSRAFYRHSWFRGGVHNDGSANPGTGGVLMATLSPAGFTLNEGKFTGDGSGLTNLNLTIPNNYNYLGINGTNVLEFGRGVSGKQSDAGKIGYQAFSTDKLDIVGAGTAFGNRKIQLFAEGGVYLNGPLFTGNNRIDQGDNSGVFMQAYGGQHSIGNQSYTTFFRTSVGGSNAQGSFAWYRGGSYSSTEKDAGGGTALAYLDGNGLTLSGGLSTAASATIGGSLTVNGFRAQGSGSSTYAFYSLSTSPTQAFTGVSFNSPSDISVYATGRVFAKEFNAFSDARLKTVIGRSDAARDLQTLLQLEIVDYTKKDALEDRGRQHKKVVAQQVEKVFPQAVTRSPGVVPDVMRPAKATQGKIALGEARSLGLSAGDTVRLLLPERELEAKITAVDEAGFGVVEKVDGEVFVYGRKVDDLRAVDYEALAMLNVSATQEMHRQLLAQKAELAAAQVERDALRREVAALRAESSRQDRRFAALEDRLERLAPAPIPAVQTAQARSR